MTRKHFIAFAQVCIDNNLDEAVIYDIAKVCQSFNSNFNMIKFFNYIDKLKENK